MTFTPINYNPYDFANRRHIGPSPAEMEAMLQAVGVKSLGIDTLSIAILIRLGSVA